MVANVAVSAVNLLALQAGHVGFAYDVGHA